MSSSAPTVTGCGSCPGPGRRTRPGGRGPHGVPGDFFTPGTEDRYPDVFGLLPDNTTGNEVLLDLLANLPRKSVALGHDVKASTDFRQQIAA
ncbi:hypothetical protein ACIHFE_33290 [Streptomyces sp. NPDC052396]|uniref:hypothetical protein n=1 Tax=Streptomyces sp. NPDC052396 TaxID=3365689 RepID=UPI0037D20ABA